MGTRHITAVISDGRVRLSQYGQWDGYFSGQGMDTCRFIRQHARNKECADYFAKDFAKKLDNLKIVSEQDFKEFEKIIDMFSGGCVRYTNNEPNNTTGYSIPFPLLFPTLSRDTGAEILGIIDRYADTYYHSKETGLPIRFTKDVSWCEFVNVVDLDKQRVLLFTNHETFNKLEEMKELDKKTRGILDKYYNGFQDYELYFNKPFTDIPSDRGLNKLDQEIFPNE